MSLGGAAVNVRAVRLRSNVSYVILEGPEEWHDHVRDADCACLWCLNWKVLEGIGSVVCVYPVTGEPGTVVECRTGAVRYSSAFLP